MLQSELDTKVRDEPQAAQIKLAERGLDLLNLFVADLQTGFGPFVATYLTAQEWTQTAIGIALSIGTITSMMSQVPAGALVDASRSKHRIAGLSIIAFTASALLLAANPIPLFVYLAEILHGFSSCTYGPAVAAISLAVVGQAAMGRRIGRNARFASIGNGCGAALLGLCGYYISTRAVFLLTAILTIPALLALIPLREVDKLPGLVSPAQETFRAKFAGVAALFRNKPLVIFGCCATLFTLANSAMLPIAAGEMTRSMGSTASLLIGGSMILPQALVATISPTVGRLTQQWGRRTVMLIGFSMLPIRGALFALITNPYALVVVQLLDGVAGACFGILVTLIASDVAGRSGHFNLALGLVGFAIGIGATFSTTLAGWVSDNFGNQAAFAVLAAIGAFAVLIALIFIPETKPVDV